MKVWHEPVAKKELPFIHIICYHVKPTQGDLSDCHGFATSPRLLRSAQCPSPKGHQSISWLNIQTWTKSTHIEHGMCFPSAREVKTNHNAKLRISCKASVNRPIWKLVYFATNDLSDSPALTIMRSSALRSHCNSGEGQRSVRLHSEVSRGKIKEYKVILDGMGNLF